MDIVALALRSTGLFYAFAGVVILRALVMDRLMDQVLAGITAKPVPRNDTLRHHLFAFIGLGTGTAGVALLVLSLWAVPLFLICLGAQLAYLLWARTAFPIEDEADAKGRRQTINAAILYGAASLAVLAAAGSGMLRDWRDAWALAIPAAGLGLVVSYGRHFFWQARRAETWPADDEVAHWPEDTPVIQPRRVRLEPAWGSYGFFDADTGEDLQPDDYLPEDLASRIHYWQYAFEPAQDGETRLDAVFEDAAHEAEHRAAGDALHDELVAIFGEGNVIGPIYPPRIFYVGPSTPD